MSILKNMNITELSGDQIRMKRTSTRHFTSAGQTGVPLETPGPNFESMLMDALGKTNESQMDSEALFQKMLTHPDEVNVHDVTLAMAKAEMSLNLTKSVVDKAVKSYKEIITLR